jgi:hypothetical protein
LRYVQKTIKKSSKTLTKTLDIVTFALLILSYVFSIRLHSICWFNTIILRLYSSICLSIMLTKTFLYSIYKNICVNIKTWSLYMEWSGNVHRHFISPLQSSLWNEKEWRKIERKIFQWIYFYFLVMCWFTTQSVLCRLVHNFNIVIIE